MRKRFGVLLTLAVLAVLVCGLSVAVAADTGVVNVGNVWLNVGEYVTNGRVKKTVSENPLPDSGYAYLTGNEIDGYVLTLNGFAYEGEGYVYDDSGEYASTSAIHTDVSLTIELIGENTIVNEKDYGEGITGDDITIKTTEVTEGTETLNITADNGISAYGDVTISGGTVEIDAKNDEIRPYFGIQTGGDVTISGGTVKIVEGTAGIDANGDVTISGGTVDITVEVRGIDAEGNVTISGGTVEIDADYGIFSEGDATISGGTVEIDAGTSGIGTYDTFRFTGGSLGITMEGEGVFVEAIEGIEIDDSLLPNGVTIEQIIEYGFYILVSESGTSIRIESKPATTNYFGKVIRSMQTISFPGVPELDGLWRAFGSTINLTKITPEPRDGYTFTGWFADEACTKPITKIVVTGNMQLFAGWEEIAEEEEETGTAEAEAEQ